MNDIELICFDMAGTTVIDNGLVLEAFRRTIDDLEVTGEERTLAEAYVIETMGQSKIEVFIRATRHGGQRGVRAKLRRRRTGTWCE
jgi:phosphoglycolate phosphatase-like HAD superfamily hydrolase